MRVMWFIFWCLMVGYVSLFASVFFLGMSWISFGDWAVVLSRWSATLATSSSPAPELHSVAAVLFILCRCYFLQFFFSLGLFFSPRKEMVVFIAAQAGQV